VIDPLLTAGLLRSLLTNGSPLPCSPVEFVVDGREVEFLDIRLKCKTDAAACDGVQKLAGVPTVVLVCRTPPRTVRAGTNPPDGTT
jgi:hypothetical protein